MWSSFKTGQRGEVGQATATGQPKTANFPKYFLPKTLGIYSYFRFGGQPKTAKFPKHFLFVFVSYPPASYSTKQENLDMVMIKRELGENCSNAKLKPQSCF